MDNLHYPAKNLVLSAIVSAVEGPNEFDDDFTADIYLVSGEKVPERKSSDDLAVLTFLDVSSECA